MSTVLELPENSEVLQSCVYPSNEFTILALNTNDEYGGAHTYRFTNCLGFSDGRTQYDESTQEIQFVRKNQDGTTIPGLQNEQIIIAMIDRLGKLNAKFPHPENQVQLDCLNGYLEACKRRVQQRVEAGVMGKLEK